MAVTGYRVKVHQSRLLGEPRRAGDLLPMEMFEGKHHAVIGALLAQGIIEPEHDDPQADGIRGALLVLTEKVDQLTARVDMLAEKVNKVAAIPPRPTLRASTKED